MQIIIWSKAVSLSFLYLDMKIFDMFSLLFFRHFGGKFLLLIQLACVASALSVCMNTPQTFQSYSSLYYITLVLDCVASVILITEMAIKIKIKGLFATKRSYFRMPWSILEFFMVICLVVSIILQILEKTSKLDKTVSNYLIISFIRTPRPLLLLRLLKAANVNLPSHVAYKSIKQIGEIILYMLYFLLVFALIGGQLFGVMDYFCIRNNADITNITYYDFTIPMMRCPPNDMKTRNHSKCPRGFNCTKLSFDGWRQHSEYFDNIFESFITVYEAMSLEGWSFKMYESMDLIPQPIGRLVGFIYFFLVLLIIGLLGRNVFIAVTTEAFADLRVVLNATKSDENKEVAHTQVFRKVDNQIKLVHIEEAIVTNTYRRTVNEFITSRPVEYFIHLAVLLDAVIQSVYFNDTNIYTLCQIIFTVLFDIEAILKIVGMGLQHYLSNSTYQFEGTVCIGSTILLPIVLIENRQWCMFQVVRPFRLIFLWSSLQLFLKKILGSAKKIGQFSLFAFMILIVSSGIFLQLFCGIGLNNPLPPDAQNSTFIIEEDSFSFDTFPKAFKAAFQIFMQEAWTEVLNDLLNLSGENLSVLVYIFLLSFHLLAAFILISVFVALIVDNLELQEELKLVKQRKLGQEIADTSVDLPWRVRIFEFFKSKPKVISVKHVEYVVPKLRESFVTNYLHSADMAEDSILSFPDFEKKKKSSRCLGKNLMDSVNQDLSKLSPSLSKQFVKNQPIVTLLMKDSDIKRGNTIVHSFSNASQTNNSFESRGRGTSTYQHTLTPTLSTNTEKGPTKVSSPLRMFDSSRRMRETDVSAVKRKMEEAQLKKDVKIQNLQENHPKFDESLFLFSRTNRFRQFIQRIVHARFKYINMDDKGAQLGAFSTDRLKRYFGTQTYLEWVMIFSTQISLLGMILEFSKHQRLFDDSLMVTIEITFITACSVELLFRIIAGGFVLGPEAVIRDFGDVLHLTIYIVSLVYIAWQPAVIRRFSGAYWLSVLRCLRPLRLITLCLPLRKEVWKVVGGYKDLFKVSILLFLLMFVFASYGVQTFSNKLMKCNDLTIKRQNDCIGFFEMELEKPGLVDNLRGEMKILVPRVWRNPRNFDFDTLGNAFLALLEMLSLEGWTEWRDTLEELSLDSDNIAGKKYIPWGLIYPHLYVFLAGLIGLTLFIGVIVSNYDKLKGTALLTVEQKRWKDLKRKLELTQPARLPPKPLENERKSRLYDMFLGPMYLKFYCVLVMINSIVLCFGQLHYGKFSESLQITLDTIGYICCTIYLIDTTIKIYTFSIKGYFISWGNRLDFVLMVAGIIFILWNVSTCLYYTKDNTDHLCHDSRNFGVGIFVVRFLTLSFKHNALQQLMVTIIMGVIKSFWNLSVLVVIIITYSYIGIIFFGSVKRGANLNNKVNFESFTNAIFLLIRIATGEDWNSLMHDAMIGEPYCTINNDTNYWKSNCGNKPLALIYFHTYNWLITYVLLNVMIGVVIENFSIFYLADNDPIMSNQDIHIFQGGWSVVDNERQGFVTRRKARFCLRLIYEWLKLDKPLMLDRMFLEIERNETNKVTFHNLLFIIAYKKIKDMSKSLQLEERLGRENLDKEILEEVAMDTIRNWVIKVFKSRRHSFKEVKRTVSKRMSGKFFLFEIILKYKNSRVFFFFCRIPDF